MSLTWSCRRGSCARWRWRHRGRAWRRTRARSGIWGWCRAPRARSTPRSRRYAGSKRSCTPCGSSNPPTAWTNLHHAEQLQLVVRTEEIKKKVSNTIFMETDPCAGTPYPPSQWRRGARGIRGRPAVYRRGRPTRSARTPWRALFQQPAPPLGPRRPTRTL